MTITIAHLLSLYAAATKGTWEAWTCICCPDRGWVEGPRGSVCPKWEETKATHTLSANDAAAIVALHNAFPALAEMITQAEKDEEEWRRLCNRYDTENAELRAEVARLKVIAPTQQHEPCGCVIEDGHAVAWCLSDSCGENK